MPADPLTLDGYLSVPRVESLALSADGRRLVAAVAAVSPDGKAFRSALWELDPGGEAQPRRLTHSPKGEGAPVFAPDGTLLFTSARPDPDAAPDPADGQEPPKGLWALPEGGEARLLADPAGGVDAVRAAADTGDLVFRAGIHPGAADLAEDRARQRARREAGVSALLFDDYPIRQWDSYLGPREPHLFALAFADQPDSAPGSADAPAASADPAATGGTGPDEEPRPKLRDLTPDVGRGLDDTDFDVSPDGTWVVTGLWRAVDGDIRHRFTGLVLIDRATGERRPLVEESAWFDAPRFSPDGSRVVAVRDELSSPDRPGDVTLWLVDLASGEGRDLCPDLDLRPIGPEWSADGSAVVFTADVEGHTLPFAVDVATGRVHRLADEGTWTHLCPAPDGSLYALRSTVMEPPRAVALAGGAMREIRTPGDGWRPPGTLQRVQAPAPDGAVVGAWLVLPPGASDTDPAPLVVGVHGGPVASWTGWNWRWNPHLLTARGYAVVLPDPALSTGYGHDWIARGWGRWGEAPYTDVMAVTDAVCARGDIDDTRVAVAGGSFGGYLVNWIAGQTDRFRAIVSHASLWSLRSFHGTTDDGWWWEKEFGDPYDDPSRYLRQSPDQHVGRITTPMLVIHGELDYRVPIGEGLRLWTDLRRHGVEGRFLYFPDENHWILQPPNIRIWYETVLAFLDEHVLERRWTRPNLL